MDGVIPMLSEDRKGKMKLTFSCDKEVGSRNSESSKASCRSEAISVGQAGATTASGPTLITLVSPLSYMATMAPRRYPPRWRGRCTENPVIGVRPCLLVPQHSTIEPLIRKGQALCITTSVVFIANLAAVP